jgi:hypothetical protein
MWQWLWNRYGARYSWVVYLLAFPLLLPFYLFWSFLVVAVEKSDHYVESAAVTVVAIAGAGVRDHASRRGAVPPRGAVGGRPRDRSGA